MAERTGLLPRTSPVFETETVLGRTIRKVLDEQSLLQAMIDFVNDESDLTSARDAIRYELATDQGIFPTVMDESGEIHDDDMKLFEKTVHTHIKDSDVDEVIATNRKRVRLMLTEALENVEKLRGSLRQYASRTYGELGIARRAVLVDRDGKLAIHWAFEINRSSRTYGNDTLLLISYAAAVLASDGNGLRRDLCRCHLETCRKFFFAKRSTSGRGKRRTRYCCEKHMQTAHEMDNARRQRVSKEKKRKAALERKPRRPPK